ncbi:MAG: Do family serine endopeptidase [Gammaproteobacteria bacterium]|nr:Do family serine endopeptidase [Gammaproteobacteria bacterium]
MSRRPFVRRTLAAAFALLVFPACQPNKTNAESAASATLAQAPAAGAAVAPAPRGVVLPDFASLVQQQGPAVVNISTKGKRMRAGVPGMSPDDPFFEFFRRFGVPGAPGGRGGAPGEGDDESTRRPGGEGSGFIVSNDGYILTNAHVVDEAEEVTVRLTDRREFTARIVGLDKPTDVAVLKIEAKDLPVVRIGNPAKLRPGEWVLAIGSPFGFDNSATAGIVSATARGLPGGDSNYVNFIQTDVAVNPGNSGGPLFNLAGEVVGINSQIYSRSGGYMGISFAIPIDVAVSVRDQIVAKGRVSRGKIGVSIQQVDATLAESFGLDRPRGALVGGVEEDGPANKAGLRQGDIILSADGRAIERSEELPTIIGAIRPSTEVTLEVWRDRAKRSFKVRVAELGPPASTVADTGKPEQMSSADRLGLVVRDVSPEERSRGGSRDPSQDQRGARAPLPEGVIVVRAQGAARDAGVQRGDFVLNVNGRPVKTVKEFREAVERGGKAVALLVQRGNSQIFIPVRGE